MNFIAKMRLFFISGLVLLLMFSMGAYSAYTIKIVNDKSTEIADIWMPSVDITNQINTLTSNYRILEYQHIVSTSQQEKYILEREMTGVIKNVERLALAYEKIDTTDADKQLFKSFHLDWEKYLTINNTVIALSREQKTQQALEIMNEESYRVFSAASEKIISLAETNRKAGEQASSEGDVLYEKSKYLLLLIIVFSFLLGCLQYISSYRLVRSYISYLEEQRITLNEMNTRLANKNNALETEISRRKEAEEKEIEAWRQAEKQERMAALGLFAAGISHEINQPLNVIKLETSSLLFWHKDGREIEKSEYEESLNIIKESIDRIDKLIRAIRFFVQSDHNIVQKNLDLGHICKMCAAEFSVRAVEAKVNFSYNAQPELYIHANQMQIALMLNNLLSNALEAVKSKPREERFISLEAFSDQKYVTVKVADSGKGIPAELKGKIFEPFFTTKGVTGGMGIGLTLVDAVVTTFGGGVEISDNPSGGTIFTVYFPKEDRKRLF